MESLYLPNRVSECLDELDSKQNKTRKMLRMSQGKCRANVEDGFYRRDAKQIGFYQFPEQKQLVRYNYDWRRSATP